MQKILFTITILKAWLMWQEKEPVQLVWFFVSSRARIFFGDNKSFFAQLASVVAVNVFGQDITSVPGIPGQVKFFQYCVSRVFRI